MRLARIKPLEEVEHGGEGLFFLFPRAALANSLQKSTTHRILPGDVLIFNGAAGSKLAVFDNKKEFLFWTFSACFENLLPLFASNEISLLHNITEGFKATKNLSGQQSPWRRNASGYWRWFRHSLIWIIAASCVFGLPPPSCLWSSRRGQSQRSRLCPDGKTTWFKFLKNFPRPNLSIFPVGDLADKFSCSRRHLNRLFHQHFGVSVAALRMEMRLLKAISLLRDPDIKIINVAEQCGFNHLGLFNTCFKRRFGTSPGQWRKSTPSRPLARLCAQV